MNQLIGCIGCIGAVLLTILIAIPFCIIPFTYPIAALIFIFGFLGALRIFLEGSA